MKNNKDQEVENSNPYAAFIGNLEGLDESLKETRSVQKKGFYSRKIAEIITDIQDFIPSKSVKKQLRQTQNLPQYIFDNSHLTSYVVSDVVKALRNAESQDNLTTNKIDKTTTQDDALLMKLIFVDKYNEYTGAIDKLGKLLGKKNPGDSSMWKHKIKWEVRDILKKNNLSLPKGFKLPIGIPDKKDIEALQKDLRQRVSVMKTYTKYNLELQNRNKTQKTQKKTPSNPSSFRFRM